MRESTSRRLGLTPVPFTILGGLSLTAAAMLAVGCSGSAPVSRSSSTAVAPGGAEYEPGEERIRSGERLLADLESAQSHTADDQIHASNARRPSGPDLNITASDARTNVSPGVTIEEVDSKGSQPTSRPRNTNDSASKRQAENVNPVLTPTQRQQALTVELASVLREIADSPEWPVPTLMQLAALELFQPGVFNSNYLGKSGGVTSLHPRDVELLTLWRDAFSDMRDQLASRGEEADLTHIAEQLAEKMRDREAVRIPTACLCTRVDGFGLYSELPMYDGQYKLLVGRRHRLIVYVELDRFAARLSTQNGVSGYQVELLQDLSLYHAGDRQDTLAWRKADQTISDFSRNRRRDFFVVQIIELPETLTIGSYRLKVRIRDDVQNPPTEAEYIIRLEMTADASAFQER